jgi:hypothetical protein
MSFQIEGQPFVPDYKAKERRLYQIIASRDDEIAALHREIEDLKGGAWVLTNDLEAVKDELRALKAKERRRATKRKAAKE